MCEYYLSGRIVYFNPTLGYFIRRNTCCLIGIKMSSHIDEKRYSVLVDYLTSCKEGGDLRDSRVYPFGATANDKRRISQQAAMFVLKERCCITEQQMQ